MSFILHIFHIFWENSGHNRSFFLALQKMILFLLLKLLFVFFLYFVDAMTNKYIEIRYVPRKVKKQNGNESPVLISNLF